MKNLILGVAIGCLAGIGAYAGWQMLRSPAIEAGAVYCTQEAKQCPDGSYVGRTGPRCEFTPCPSGGSVNVPPVTNVPPTDDGLEAISYSYQQPLTTTYITGEEWPPTVRVALGTYRCDTTSTGTTERVVGEQRYCLNVIGDGAAGHFYTTYNYMTWKGSYLIQISFVLRATQCGVYDDPQKTTCEREQAAFNSDVLADRVAQSVRIE